MGFSTMRKVRLPQPLVAWVASVPLPLWMGVMLIVPIGIGAWAVWRLSLMDVVTCHAVDEKAGASESTALYCAQLTAESGTADDLAKALRLASSIGADHPLWAERDRLVQRWTTQLIELGEQAFQAGRLEEAITTIRKVPDTLEGASQVEQQVKAWRSTWAEAETVYQDVTDALQADDPDRPPSFLTARKLLTLGNQYWQTTKYQELLEQIQAAKEARQKTVAKQRQSDSARSKNVAFDPAMPNGLMTRWKQEQAADAEAKLRQADGLAERGDLSGAIATAETIMFNTPQYAQVQDRLDRWTKQLEAREDRPYLERAMSLASRGDVESLQSAISEARNIYYGRALYAEAQSQIDRWSDRVQQLEAQTTRLPEFPVPPPPRMVTPAEAQPFTPPGR